MASGRLDARRSQATRYVVEEEQALAGLDRLRGVRHKFWLYLLVVFLVAIVCSLIGRRIGHRQESWIHDLENTVSIFPSGFPSQQEIRSAPSKGAVVALYAAALFSLALTIRILWSFLAQRWTERRAARRSRHVVICGLGEKGLRAAVDYLDREDAVTCIDLAGTSDLALAVRNRGALVLEGDATQRHVLAGAAAHRAREVVCACTEDGANTSIAAQVENLVQKEGGSPTVYVHISNPDLTGILDTPTVGVGKVRLEFFNIFELWSHRLADAAGLTRLAREGGRPRVVVAGSSGLSRILVVQIARKWYGLCDDPKRRPTITLVCANATAEASALTHRYPALARTAELVPVDFDISSSNPIDLGSLGTQEGDPLAVYFCLPIDGDNINLALQAERRLPGARIVVPASAWTEELHTLLRRGRGGIAAIGYTSPGMLKLLDRQEVMAREAHEAYRAGPDARPESDVGWDELSEEKRQDNRHQITMMAANLRALWFEIDPSNEWDRPSAELGPTDVETLAELEHERWLDAKRAAGTTHPDMRPWRELTKETADKDRLAVRAWPAILARAGYELRRRPEREQLAELIHERHRQDRLRAGETEERNPLLRPWSELSEEERDASRASADAIGLKLRQIGCRTVPLDDADPRFAFTSAELELLAEREHERWCEERKLKGWRHGDARDDGKKRHPDLVPWSELPEDRRQIDRDHVAAIPDLLAAIGLGVVPERT